ncbi:MAG: hypothetical protein ACJ70X_09620 [Nitrososphaera sp.]
MTDHSKEEKTVSIATIAIVVALALLGVVVMAALTIPLQQQAEAKGVCETPGLLRSAIHSGNQSLTSCT